MHGYAVNESTGVLTPIPGLNPLLTGQNGDGGTIGERIEVGPVNRRLYVIIGGLSRSLYVHSINGVAFGVTLPGAKGPSLGGFHPPLRRVAEKERRSIAPESHHRIDLCRAPRRNPAGEQGDSDQ